MSLDKSTFFSTVLACLFMLLPITQNNTGRIFYILFNLANYYLWPPSQCCPEPAWTLGGTIDNDGICCHRSYYSGGPSRDSDVVKIANKRLTTLLLSSGYYTVLRLPHDFVTNSGGCIDVKYTVVTKFHKKLTDCYGTVWWVSSGLIKYM